MSELSWDASQREDTLLVEYEDIVKGVSVGVLKKLQEFEETYKDVIDYRMIKDMDEKNLTRLCTQRVFRNVLDYVRQNGDFETDESLKYIMELDDIYDISPSLKFINVIELLRHEKFVKEILIFTEDYDVRVHYDLMKIFPDFSKIKYVYGKIENIIEEYPRITFMALSDIEKLHRVSELDQMQYKEIILGDYGYNVYFDEETGNTLPKIDMGKLIEGGRYFKIAMFLPLDFTDEHFTDIRDLKG